MSESTVCPCCGYPGRELLTPSCLPGMSRVELGNWMELDRCPACGQLWCVVSHGSGASFNLAAAWPCDRPTFHRLTSLENSRILHEWHMAMVREHIESLPPEEREAVQSWLAGIGSGHGVLEHGPWMASPAFVRSSKELEEYT